MGDLQNSLLIIAWAVLGVGLTAVFLGSAIYRSRMARSQNRVRQELEAAGVIEWRDPTLPAGFGYKVAWLAISSTNALDVAKALSGGIEPVPATWGDGIGVAYTFPGKSVFVTPAVDDWVFVVGWPVWPSDKELLRRTLIELSKRFGHCQAFVSMRISSSYGWARAIDGEVLRVVEIGDGSVFVDDGTPTDAEPDIHDEDEYINEDSVLELAAEWSLDPTAFDERQEPRENGFVISDFASPTSAAR